MLKPANPPANPVPPSRAARKAGLAHGKFQNPNFTAAGEERAKVRPVKITALWFNTGSLCNITCRHCYIESSPSNDRLVYLSAKEVGGFLDEAEQDNWPVEEIGFTGGEPFLNPDFPSMLEDALARGYRALVLTNAMRPMLRPKPAAHLASIQRRYGAKLIMRVSLDHYTAAGHDAERGKGSFAASCQGLVFLRDHGFRIHLAARACWEESEENLRAGFARLCRQLGLQINADNREELVVFPEMDELADVPEITSACWEKLGVKPAAMMCASSRMIVKRKGAERPVVLPCTLLPYGKEFEMGASLRAAHKPVALNHPHCARFCVLGGASCSKLNAAEMLG